MFEAVFGALVLGVAIGVCACRIYDDIADRSPAPVKWTPPYPPPPFKDRPKP